MAGKVLLVYGGGSIKRNGIYDTLMPLLKEGVKQTEVEGKGRMLPGHLQQSRAQALDEDDKGHHQIQIPLLG